MKAIPPIHTDAVRLRLWARFLFCYVRGDRDRSDEYLAQLWEVFEKEYPKSITLGGITVKPCPHGPPAGADPRGQVWICPTCSPTEKPLAEVIAELRRLEDEAREPRGHALYPPKYSADHMVLVANGMLGLPTEADPVTATDAQLRFFCAVWNALPRLLDALETRLATEERIGNWAAKLIQTPPGTVLADPVEAGGTLRKYLERLHSAGEKRDSAASAMLAALEKADAKLPPVGRGDRVEMARAEYDAVRDMLRAAIALAREAGIETPG